MVSSDPLWRSAVAIATSFRKGVKKHLYEEPCVRALALASDQWVGENPSDRVTLVWLH
jgi:hypothetical protein